VAMARENGDTTSLAKIFEIFSTHQEMKNQNQNLRNLAWPISKMRRSKI
jgi:hypothetical protein